MDYTQITGLSATELVSLIKKKEIKVTEVVKAYLKQIERVNPKVNAIVTLLSEDVILKKAEVADKKIANNEVGGSLFGLPIAHKDMVCTKGIKTTFGSPIYKNYVPNFNSLIVDRMQNAGAITIGKTNTPEFAAGSQTFNKLFGATCNPYDTSKTCGGSSGGAAVSLATRMLPLADGSDMGGSLRNPASFCNVVGFRPSPGRVPDWPTKSHYPPLSVSGPMARNVKDLALMMSVMSGPTNLNPFSINENGSIFLNNLNKDFRNTKIAWSPNLGDFDVEEEILDTIKTHLPVFENIGCTVEEIHPSFKHADDIFKTFRAWLFYIAYNDLLKSNRDQIKETVIWNIEQGQKLTIKDIAKAENKFIRFYERISKFFEKYDYLILPTCQVLPFDINKEYLTEINGKKMDTYLDWMKSNYYISATRLPAISIPCGFSKTGLPIGLQIVGKPQADFSVLQLAYAFEQQTNYWKKEPSIIN
jgi:amidase